MEAANILLVTFSVVVACVSAYVAYRTLKTTLVTHELSMLQRSLEIAIDSFEKRYSDEKYNELELLIVQCDPSDINFREGDHYVLVRALNYYLKPVAAWCDVAQKSSHMNTAAAHKLFASIILTRLQSRQHVLLFILEALDSRTPDNIHAHRPILRYIEAHVEEEWHETLMGNRIMAVTRLQNSPWV